ncbi:MAG: ROK family transcriptional regulator [Candidatus Nanopelagicales bacterium]
MISTSPVNNDDVKRHNLARVLRYLHEDGELSRSELVARTGLTRSTVGALVSDLVITGIVEEVPGSGGSVGRPSLVVRTRESSAFVIAFDLRVDRIVGAAISIGGRVIAQVERPKSDGPFAVAKVTEVLIDCTSELFEHVPNGSAWVGVGIAIPGVIDAEIGLVRKAPNLGWLDVNFEEHVTRELNAVFGATPRVILGNDANLGAIAEFVRGAGRNASSVVYLSGDVGVGGGVALEGRVLSGASGYAGEIGHMVVNPGGHACNCGNTGCWETEVGRDAILRSSGDFSGISNIIEAVISGDAQAIQGLRGVGRWIGIGLSNLVNTFDPGVIVLGGHLADVYPFVRDEVIQEITKSRPLFETRALITLPSFDIGSTLVGASEIAFAALLNDPLTEMDRSLALSAS